MKLPQLKIGNLVPELPIIQGGMAVRISMAPLASAVASEGGVGVIAGTGIPVAELAEEIRKARSMSQGIIGVNIMFAASNFADLVLTSLTEGIDLIISGAGFSRDIFAWGKKFNVPIVPIVSSAKLAKIAEKLGAAAVVVEGKEAGGHLGTDRSVKEIVPEVRQAVTIPVIAAGGIIDGRDICEAFEYGADGVQMATRFVATHESSAPPAMKQMYLSSKSEDVVLINSPVGLPARGLRNAFSEELAAEGQVAYEACRSCLKQCSHSCCLLGHLEDAQRGDVDMGAVFCGENVHRINDVLSVREVMQRLREEIKKY